MTVIHPWPLPHPAHRSTIVGAIKASFPPPREPMPGRFAIHFPLDLPALTKARPGWVRHAQGWRAATAELVLLNRLRARTRTEPGRHMLDRAARIIEVTARHWFGDETAPPLPA